MHARAAALFTHQFMVSVCHANLCARQHLCACFLDAPRVHFSLMQAHGRAEVLCPSSPWDG